MDYKDVARNFGLLDRRTRAYVTMACDKWGIGFSEYVILENLYDHEGCTQDDLAAMIMADKAIVTRSIKLLEDKQIVFRRQNQQDKRCKNVYLTKYGKCLETEMADIVRNWVDLLATGIDQETIERVMDSLHVAAAQVAKVDMHEEEIKIKGELR